MKKTLIALVALAGNALATSTEVWDLTQTVTGSDYQYDASTGILNGSTLSDQLQTNISFTLNLTEALTVEEDTLLLEMDMDTIGKAIALYLTSEGMLTICGGQAEGSKSWQEEFYDTLNRCSFTSSAGDQCVTLTFVQTPDEVQMWSNDEQVFFADELNFENSSLSSIYINKDYVEALQFTPGKSEDVAKTNAAFDAKVKERLQLVPEPTTASLSLLALAGLALRRRRK